jgi:ADP-heptose:LPS heptosyltransferase
MSDRPESRAATSASRFLKLDCRHYRGDRPCLAGVQGACPPACDTYAPHGTRIVIIKLGALGDVIRTLALLPALKHHYPQSHVTWVTRPNGVRMLANHPLIDRLLPFDSESICHLEYERFDLCLSLDKEPGPAALAMRLDAGERRGIGLSRNGTPFPLNEACGHYFVLGLDDTAKFHGNTQSYQALLFDALELRYRGERYTLYPSAADRARAAAFWQSRNVTASETIVGLNTGAGRVFANKTWHVNQFRDLARKLVQRPGWRVALFGGPDETERNAQLAADVPGAIDTGGAWSELTFAALLSRANVLVTGDTMALHVAIAAQTPAVALFGPTCAPEIDLYGCGEKLVTALPCAPCYRRTCDVTPNCMDSLDVATVLAAVNRWAVRNPQPAARALPVLSEVSA